MTPDHILTIPRLPRVPLPRQTGGAHKTDRKPSRARAKELARKERDQ